MSLAIRLSRSALPRATRHIQLRTFITTPIRQADLVQELYLRELRNYKPAPLAPNDAEGHVATWSAPKPPKSPEERNIASELQAYETQAVETEGQVEGGASGAGEEDWFVDEEEAPASAGGGH